MENQSAFEWWDNLPETSLDKPKQFRIYKYNFGWVVSEIRKNVKKRFLRSDVVTWDYEVLNMIGKYKNPLSCSHTPFRTKDEAIEWLKEIIKGRKEPPTASLYSYDIEYFNESDLI